MFNPSEMVGGFTTASEWEAPQHPTNPSASDQETITTPFAEMAATANSRGEAFAALEPASQHNGHGDYSFLSNEDVQYPENDMQGNNYGYAIGAVNNNNATITHQSETDQQPPPTAHKALKPSSLSSPITNIRLTPNGQWKENKKNGATIPESTVMERIISHVRTCAERESCIDVYGTCKNCTCLRALAGKEDVIVNCARGLLKSYYGIASSEGKTRFVITQMRHANAYGKVLKKFMPKGSVTLSYLIPYEEDASNYCNTQESTSKNSSWDASESQIFLCTWGFCSLLSIGREQYKRYSRTNPVVPVKTTIRKGNTNRQRNEEVYNDLKQYIQQLIPYARPLPPSSIPASTKKKIRETENQGEVLFLPPEFKYLRLYKDWCLRRGKVVKFRSAKLGYFCPMDQYEDRPFDAEWPVGSVSMEVVAFKTFKDFWKRNFPMLHVQMEGKQTR